MKKTIIVILAIALLAGAAWAVKKVMAPPKNVHFVVGVL